MDKNDYRKRIREAYGPSYQKYIGILILLLAVVFAGSLLLTQLEQAQQQKLSQQAGSCTEVLSTMPKGYAICCGEKDNLQDCTDRGIPSDTYVSFSASLTDKVKDSRDSSACLATNIDITNKDYTETDSTYISCTNVDLVFGRFGYFIMSFEGYSQSQNFIEIFLVSNADLRDSASIANKLIPEKRIFSWKGGEA